MLQCCPNKLTMPKTPQEPKISHLLGKAGAHLQDGFDRVCEWGFGQLQKVDTKPKKDEHKVIKASRKIGGFLGELGTKYYSEYEDIKKKRTKK